MAGKERALPLSESQRVVLLNMIKNRDKIINNKSTAPGITEQKKNAWEDISKNFNSQYPDQAPRSSKQLKRSYDHVKSKVKEEENNFRKKTKTTGGGPPPTPPKPSEEISLAASMMDVDLAMGNDVYETFSLIPDDGRSSPVMYVLDKENDPGVVEQIAAARNLNFSSTPIHTSCPSLSPNKAPASSSTSSTIPSTSAVTTAPLRPLQSRATSSMASCKPPEENKHTKVRISAKDDADMCRSRQEEFHRLKISHMMELQELEKEQLKLSIQKQKLEIEEIEKRSRLLEKETEKRCRLLEDFQNKVDDVHKNLTGVLSSAKRAYDTMGYVDEQ